MSDSDAIRFRRAIRLYEPPGTGDRSFALVGSGERPGRFRVACLDRDDHAVVRELERRYPDLDVGLADLSVVVVAARAGTRRIASFDHRHFGSLRSLNGGHFTLLPATGGN